MTEHTGQKKKPQTVTFLQQQQNYNNTKPQNNKVNNN